MIFILIRPFTFFNHVEDYYAYEGLPGHTSIIDYSKLEVTPLMRKIVTQLNIHGALNDLLTAIFSFVRVYLLTNSMIYLVQENLVQEYRVGKIMGFQMTTFRLYKFFYKSHKVKILLWGLICLMCIMVMLIVEFERFNIMDIINQVWYMVCTITTVGYGDYYAMNLFGQVITIWAVFVGSFMEACFVLSLLTGLKLDGFQQGAYYTIRSEQIEKDC